jgi:hypothetical protein
MKLKAKGGNGDHILEKFSAQSSKSAKYAKTTVKKREGVVGQGVVAGSEVKENKAEGGGTASDGQGPSTTTAGGAI